MHKRDFSAAVRRRIRAQKIKPAALAEVVGCSESNVRAWNKQGVIPSVVNADALLRALGVKLTIGDKDGPDLEV